MNFSIRPQARLLRTRLADLGAEVEMAGFTGPVLLLIGEAMRRARQADDLSEAPAPAVASA